MANFIPRPIKPLQKPVSASKPPQKSISVHELTKRKQWNKRRHTKAASTVPLKPSPTPRKNSTRNPKEYVKIPEQYEPCIEKKQNDGKSAIEEGRTAKNA